MRFFVPLLTVLTLIAGPAFAMDGVVTDTGDLVTVEDGTQFNEGDTISVYDADGTMHEMQVMSVDETDDAITVDFSDGESEDPKTVEFAKKK